MADNRAQYAIDIAARLTGGTATLDQIEQLSSSLLTGGKDADFFAEATKQVDESLRAATAAAEAANAPLEEGLRIYRELESAALKTAKASERAALKSAGVVPPELAAQAAAAKAALDNHAGTLRDLEQAAKLAGTEETRLTGVQKNLVKVQAQVNKSLAGAAEQTGKFKEAIGSVGGPLGGVSQRGFALVDTFTKLSQTFGGARAASILLGLGVAALTAVVVALSVAAVAGVASVAAWGVEMADAARNADLSTEAFEAANPSIKGYAEAADQAAYATGLTDEALRSLALKLKAAKVAASDFPEALEAAAVAERALGSGGSEKFFKDIESGSKAVKDLARNVKASLGGIVEKQMLSLGAQGQRLKKNLGEIFGGLGIDPVLEGLQTLGALFDSDTESGQTLKLLFDSFFQPLLDGFANAVPAIESFFLGFEIGLLKLAIFLKPAGKAISEFLGFNDSSTEETLASVAKVGEYLAYAVAGVAAAFVTVAAVVLPAVVVALLAVSAVVLGVGAAITGLAATGYYTAQALAEVFEGFGDKALEVGQAIVMGLANGIAAGASFVYSSLSNVVQGAIDGAKRLLGIASPSKVFEGIGDNTVQGYADGVNDTAPEAHAAVESALEPPQSALSKSDLSSPANQRHNGSEAGVVTKNSSSSDSSMSLNLAGAVFNFHGVQGSEDAEQRMRQLFQSILSGELTQSGGAG